MGAIGTILMAVGWLIAAIGSIWIIVIAFKESVLWGLGSIFIPFVILIFVFTHWNDTKKPFLISIGGMVLFGLGVLIGGPGMIPTN